MPEERLDSWKEIAAYLNRSVRTVKRWEREEGMPVHRHQHRTLGSVYAHRTEIDAWRESVRRTEPAPERTRSIAVLSFANLSEDRENEYFAEGLTEEVTANLSKVRALRVTSRTSSKALRDVTRSAKAIATQLGVQYLVEGSVRRSGERLRITAQLIDASNDEHLWAGTYDGTLEDVFAMQERLARVIVEALEVRLTSDEEARLAHRPIDDIAAYDCYLRARHEAWRWRKDAIDNAVRLLQQALAIIGDNALLYAALGFAHLQYREAGIDFGEAPLLEAERCAGKAFALEPDSAAAIRLRGWNHYSRSEIQEAVRDLKTALETEPSNADSLLLLSNCYLISGRVPAARPLITRLLAIDPLTPLVRCMPAWASIVEGDFSAAIGPYRQMLEMDPANPMARLFYLWVLVLNGRDDEVAALVPGFPPETRESLPARIALFLAHALEGREPELTPEMEAAAKTTDVFARFIAHGFALLGKADPAIRWLSVAVERGFINYPFLVAHDPVVKAFRTDSRVERLLENVRERWERFEF